MKLIFLSRQRFFCLVSLAGICLFLLACGGGSGGSGGTGVAVTGGGGIFSGRVTAPADLRIGLRAQAGSATVVPRALVWLENSPDNTSLTDENGFFTLTNVPFSVAQRVVCRYDIAAGQELYLYRSEPIVINPGEPARQLNDLQLSKGIYSISGVLQNQAGQPVQNARIRLWGIEFSTDSNGYFTSPPLPESADKEKLLIMAPGFRDYEIELPVIKSENNQIKLEITLSDNSEPNFAPVPYFSQVPSQTSPAERILLRLQVIDPDELKSDQFKPIWSKTAGTIEETSNPLEIYWTAPNTAGLATISASVTDSRGATGQVELGIAVGGLKTQVLRIDSVTPAAATHETRITIKGSGFGTDKSKIQISFNGISGVIHSCTDQEIITEVPAGAATGILLLNTPNGEKSAGIFNVIDSSMSISPTFGPPGTVINISGNGFGNSAPNGARVVINGVNATIQSWADELVVASIPENATAGIVSIITGDKTRSVGFFKVTRLFSISESATRHGAQLTITGEGFGDQQGNSVIKFAGPANAPVNSWSDGKIIVQVPADAVTGELTATVQQLTITLGSLDVVGITQMTPTLAIAGNEVTVSGTGFGSEQGSSVLKVGEASAEILSWSNQQIKFKIPPSAKPADVKVVKTGNYSNSTLLTVLGLTSISHSRRPAGSTLTIKGHGFGTNTGFVLLDETALTSFSKWTDEEINLILPTSISGDFQLKVSVQGVRSPALNFSVAKVSGIDNSDGWPGREVIISGQKLGTGQNGDQVLFQNLPAPVISWQDAEIRVRVPADATTGSMTLIIGEWPVVLATEFKISRNYEYTQASPDWSGPRANSRPLLPGVAIDSNETIFATDYDNGWVWKISKDGNQQKFGNLSNPWGIAIAPDSRGIYVADSGNNCIRVFDANGNLKRTIGSAGSGNLQFSNPRGLAFAQNGYLLVADAGNNRIEVLDSLDAFVTSFGSYGTGNGQFYSPSGITVDTNLVAYVADSRNHRIQRFIPNSTTNPGTWTFSGWLGSNDPNASSPGWLTTGSGLSSSKDGAFNQPYGIGITDDGKLLIADTNNNRIQVFTASTGLFSSKIGAAGTTSGQLNQPLAVIFAGTTVIVADSSNARIQKTSIDGAFISQSAPDTSRLITNPRRLAVDSKNRRFYVLDRDDSSITVFDLEGNPLQILGSKGSGREQFYLPEGLCVDSDGNLFVADTGNARIQKLSAKGEFLQNWGVYGSGSGQFYQPSAITVSNDGQYLYITDASLNRVQKFSNQGSFIKSWGKSGNDDEGFNNPSGIAIDRNNYLYVVDQENHRVKKYDNDGNFIGWWGAYDAGAQAFWLDPASNRTGALSDANGAFDTPTDVAVDLEGNVFVTDSNNFRIQRFASKQSESADAGYQTEIYFGDTSSALTLDAWGTAYCLSSGKTVLRFLPDL